MKGLRAACLALSTFASYCNAAIRLPSSNGFLTSFNPSNVSQSNLGLPLDPPTRAGFEPHCSSDLSPPGFRGGQMVYSLLCVLSDIWKNPNDPVLQTAYRTRNVPFYSIETIIMPISGRPVLTNAKIAAYIYLFLLWETTSNVDWPNNGINCDLVIAPSELRIGKLWMNVLPEATSGAITDQVSANKELAATGTDVRYTGTKTKDRTILELFTRLLGYVWRCNRAQRVNLSPPENHFCNSEDGTMSLSVRGPTGVMFPQTVEKFAEAIMRILLLVTLAEKWESMEGDWTEAGRVVATIVIAPVRASSGAGTRYIGTA